MAILNSIFSSQAGGIARFSADQDDIIIGDSDTTFDADANWNIAIGRNALDATSGAALRNVAIGEESLTLVTTGDDNIAIGYQSGAALTGVEGNVLIGSYTMSTSNGGDKCVFIGFEAGKVSTGDENVGIGYRALLDHTSGTYNTGIGYHALTNVTDGESNTAVGNMALSTVTQGDYNVAIGHKAANTLTGNQSIAIGFEALGGHGIGSHNIAIGWGAMKDTNAGGSASGSTYNMFIGSLAGGGQWADVASTYNVGLGHFALYGALSGALNNTAVGYRAGYAITSGSGNTLIGYQADVDGAADSYSTKIGSYGAKKWKSRRIDITKADSTVDTTVAEVFKIPANSIITMISARAIQVSASLSTYSMQLSLSTTTGHSADDTLDNAGTSITLPDLLGVDAVNTYQQNSGILMAGAAADIILGNAVTDAATNLEGGILSTDATSIPVEDGTKFVIGDNIKVESEWMRVTDISTNTLTVIRGRSDTTAATHADDTDVYISDNANKVYINRPNTTIVGVNDTYLYVVNSVNNGTSDSGTATLDIVVEYF